MFHAPLGDDAELRLLEPRHAEELFTVTDRHRDHLRAWLPWVDGTRTPLDSRAFIHRSLRRFADDGSFDAGLFVDDALAGVIGIHAIDRANRATSLGYWLAADAVGRGLVTRAAQRVLAHCFQALDLNRVEIRCATGNARSRAIPERLGFTLEGVARESEWLHDRFVDHAVYSLLRAEWPDSPAARA